MRKFTYWLTMTFVMGFHFLFAQYTTKSTDWNMDAYESHVYSDANGIMPYRLLKPQQINPSVKYPLVIMLHGKGEGIGQDCSNKNGQNFCNLLWGGQMHYDSIGKYPSYVVFPQTGGGDWFSDKATNLLKGVIQSLLKNYKIDLDRVMIHGLSGGGSGVWQLAYKYPALFAAISPHSAAGDPTFSQNVLFTPIWTVQGALDTEVRPQVSIGMFNELRNDGQFPILTFDEQTQRQKWPDPSKTGGLPIYTLIPNQNHVVWHYLYDSPTWLKWLYSQNKNKIQVVGRTILSPGETTILGVSPGFDAYEWSNGATTNKIVVNKPGTYRVRYLRKSEFFSGTPVWSYWTEPVSITVTKLVGPTVNAGNDIVIQLPTNYCTIGGYGAGGGLTYSWSKVSGGAANLSNSNSNNLTISSMQEGTYVFRLTVKDKSGRVSMDDVNVYVVNPDTKPVVKSFTLVNSDNGEDIRMINNGDVISLSSLPKHINIRINVYPFSIGSVKMDLDGVVKTDNMATYTYFGENDKVYYPGSLSIGTHTLSAIPYTQLNGGGIAGEGMSVKFTIVKTLKTQISDPVSLQEKTIVTDSSGVTVFPNPFYGSLLNMQFEQRQFNVHVSVYDMMGNLIHASEMYYPGEVSDTEVNMSQFPPGIYRLGISSDKIQNKFVMVVKK